MEAAAFNPIPDRLKRRGELPTAAGARRAGSRHVMLRVLALGLLQV